MIKSDSLNLNYDNGAIFHGGGSSPAAFVKIAPKTRVLNNTQRLGEEDMYKTFSVQPDYNYLERMLEGKEPIYKIFLHYSSLIKHNFNIDIQNLKPFLFHGDYSYFSHMFEEAKDQIRHLDTNEEIAVAEKTKLSLPFTLTCIETQYVNPGIKCHLMIDEDNDINGQHRHRNVVYGIIVLNQPEGYTFISLKMEHNLEKDEIVPSLIFSLLDHRLLHDIGKYGFYYVYQLNFINYFLRNLSSFKICHQKIRDKIKIKDIDGNKHFHKISEIVHICPTSLPAPESNSWGSIDWTHRWWVRAHWRGLFQKDGISIDYNRIGEGIDEEPIRGYTWVSEHTRGGEDKPLLEKVRHVTPECLDAEKFKIVDDPRKEKG